MALTQTLGTALDATSNPDPNSLGTKAPYLSPSVSTTPSAAWTAQGKKALFPLGIKDGGGLVPLKMHFVPSGGAAVTFSVTVWMYDSVSGTWAKPKNNATVSYTGENIDYIDNPGYDAIFLQLSSISAGTLSIYFDGTTAAKG